MKKILILITVVSSVVQVSAEVGINSNDVNLSQHIEQQKTFYSNLNVKLEYSNQKATEAFTDKLVGNTNNFVKGTYDKIRGKIQQALDIYNHEGVMPDVFNKDVNALLSTRGVSLNQDYVNEKELSPEAKAKMNEIFGEFVDAFAFMYSKITNISPLLKFGVDKIIGCDINIVVNTFENNLNKLDNSVGLNLFKSFIDQAKTSKNEVAIKAIANDLCKQPDDKLKFMEQVAYVFVTPVVTS